MVRYWIGFNKVSGIGPARLRALIKTFGDVESAWNASPEALGRAGMPSRVINALTQARATLDLDAEVSRIRELGFRVLSLNDQDYPESLREIHSPRYGIDLSTRWQVNFSTSVNSPTR